MEEEENEGGRTAEVIDNDKDDEDIYNVEHLWISAPVNDGTHIGRGKGNISLLSSIRMAHQVKAVVVLVGTCREDFTVQQTL